jgi:hypothetical protein
MRNGHRERSERRPIIVVGGAESRTVDAATANLRAAGHTVYPAHGSQACLRVAIAAAADLVVVDRTVPRRTEALLAAHPSTAHARVFRLV